MKIVSKNEQETKKIAQVIGEFLSPGTIVCLNGDLGAGKTTFTKYLAESFGIAAKDVTSPSYTIVNEYHGNETVYHFDVYRLFTVDELFEIGFEEYLYSDAIVIIEWAKKIKEVLPADCLWLEINLGEHTNERVIIIRSEQQKLVSKLKEVL